MSIVSTLVLMLPDPPQMGDVELHWWRINDGAIAASDIGDGWREQPAERLVLLAPVADVALSVHDRPENAKSDRQAEAIARAMAGANAVGDPSAMHSASMARDGRILVARTDNRLMLDWLDWAQDLGLRPDALVPVAALVPPASRPVQLEIGGQHMLVKDDIVFPDEAGLAEALLGTEITQPLSKAKVEALLLPLADSAKDFLDLMTGRFKPRRGVIANRSSIRKLGWMAAALALLSLLVPLAYILKMNGDSRRLDADTLAMAREIAGPSVTLESAEAMLAAKAGSRGGGLSAPMSSLLAELEKEPGVSVSDLTYRGDGTLGVTLAASDVEAINRALVSLQRSGHSVTAVPRQSPDGRAMAQISVRAGQ